jgi:hypothetical protein
MSWLTRSGGVGLHPVAGVGDPLDPHVRDPGAVRLGQLPAQVAVLVSPNDEGRDVHPAQGMRLGQRVGAEGGPVVVDLWAMPLALVPFVNPIAPVRASRDDNDQPSTAPAIPLLLTIADRFSPRNIHVLLLLVIACRTLASGLLSTRNRPRRAMHQGCVRSCQRGREAVSGWWPTWRSCRWAGRSITPASSPTTTRSTFPATVSPRAGGTAPPPQPWGCRAKHRCRVPGDVRGPRPHHWPAARPPPRQQRRARVRRGAAADQDRLGPVRPG